MKKIFEYDYEVITHRTINTEEIKGTDFVFYEDIREVNENGNENFYIKRHKGVTSKENIEAVTGMDDIDDIVKTPKMYEGKAIVAVISKDDYQKLMNGELHITEVVQYLKNIDYSEDKYILVLYNWMSYKIADLNYNFISIPISFDFIDSGVDNYKYDLNKLLKKLKNDEHVCHRENLKISDVPYYISDYEDRITKVIEFKYLLPNDIYNEIVNMDSYTIKKYILDNIIGAKEYEINHE